MKKILSLLLVILLVLGLISCNNNSKNNEENKNDDKEEVVKITNNFFSVDGMPMLCAHRGGSVRNPENTMKAFNYSVEECMADILESDVWITKDGHLVLLHDSTVLRTSDANTYLGRNINLTPKDFTLDELKELNFGAKFTDISGSKPYQNIVNNEMTKEERKRIINENMVGIVTFDELLENFYDKNKDLLFIVEIKNSHNDGCIVADKINEILNKYPDYKNNVCIGTFNNEVEEYISNTYPNMITGASTKDAEEFVMDILFNNTVKESYSFKCLQIPTSYSMNSNKINLIDEKLLKIAHEKDIAVQYWTINDIETMKLLIDAGCDAIMTDDPTTLRKVLDEKK